MGRTRTIPKHMTDEAESCAFDDTRLLIETSMNVIDGNEVEVGDLI